MMPSTQYVCRWDSGIPGKVWRHRGQADVPIGHLAGGTPPVSEPQKFAGHVPNRVLVGMACQAGSTPGPAWADAGAIIGQPIYEARRFSGGWISTSEFNSMVGEADLYDALANISFKVPGGSNATGWGQVLSGSLDADLASLASMVRSYGKPIIVSFEHEPSGSGVTDSSLAVWAAMHTRMAYYFAGFRSCTVTTGGTVTLGAYNAANDLSLNNGGNMSWGPVGNGFWWRVKNSSTLNATRDAAWPAWSITALNTCKGIVQNDFYDCDYVDQTKALTDPAYRTPGSGVRTSVRIQNFIDWARTVGVEAAGCGEYGVIDDAEMLACWAVMRANRDIWALSNYFNSANNSDHDWRVVPANYPDTSYVSSKGFVDFGGNTQSSGRLAAFKTTLTESISAAYTGPLGV